ncbi:thioredoxin family protein [Hysterangium stoloniferum]|nr:thioredoxin family protein [Hysterangium stoloniferum]
MSQVQLYVYDLSNGLARQLSLQMTGRQIDGIWHTSVVVFGKEIFYGQGISITLPGKSHHGTPLKVVDMGETAIDEGTFEEYLNEIRGHYTADKYHLLDFNCNSFTNDCVGFLTGGSIPSWIKDLPQEFLSTPFGAALRPTIDNMYRPPSAAPSTLPPSQAPTMDLGASLLQAVASQASSNAYPTPSPTPRRPSPATSTLTAPLQIATNPASLNAIVASHRCVSVFFTSATCPPCRLVEPVFEELARANAGSKVAFVKVDLGMGGVGFDVRATPTFWFYLDGKKMDELKGADAGELRTQVNLLLFQAFPAHPHTTQSYPTIRAISLQPILFSQPPAWDAALAKLNSFIDTVSIQDFDGSKAKNVLTQRVVPFLRARFSPTCTSPMHPSADLLRQWSASTVTLAHALPAHEIFPLVDFWRLGLLDTHISSWAAAGDAGIDIVEILLKKAIAALDIASPSPRNLLLTTLRLLANCFANPILARHILSPISPNSPRERLTALLVPTLLHTDAPVRTAAASLAFNIAAHQQRPLVEAVKNGRKGDDVPDNAEGEGQGDWEVEVVSAVVEALRKEENEDVVHRLTASLALLLHLSPYWNQLESLMEVVGVKDALEAKMKVVKKSEVQKLMKEVVGMCV